MNEKLTLKEIGYIISGILLGIITLIIALVTNTQLVKAEIVSLDNDSLNVNLTNQSIKDSVNNTIEATGEFITETKEKLPKHATIKASGFEGILAIAVLLFAMKRRI